MYFGIIALIVFVDNTLARLLLALNEFLILFGYDMVVILSLFPTDYSLLKLSFTFFFQKVLEVFFFPRNLSSVLCCVALY